MSDTGKEIFMIYSPHGHAPQGAYDNFNEAMHRAKKLSDKYPGESFHVMQAINELKVPAPEVIKKGDTVWWGTAATLDMVVLYCGGKMACIQYKDRKPCNVPVEQLTLIRKGPKVITFEGVHFNHSGMTANIRMPGADWCRFDKATGGHTRHTMTLKEEKDGKGNDGESA